MAGITHLKQPTVPDWTQARLDQMIAIGLYAPGTKLTDIVLPSNWLEDHVIPDFLALKGIGGNIVTAAGNYVATPTDYTIEADASAGNMTVTLPVTKYQLFNVVKVDSSGNTVTVLPASGTISGAANKTITTQWNSMSFQGNGTNIRVL